MFFFRLAELPTVPALSLGDDGLHRRVIETDLAAEPGATVRGGRPVAHVSVALSELGSGLQGEPRQRRPEAAHRLAPTSALAQ
jgi:hypothetical protein